MSLGSVSEGWEQGTKEKTELGRQGHLKGLEPLGLVDLDVIKFFHKDDVRNWKKGSMRRNKNFL